MAETTQVVHGVDVAAMRLDQWMRQRDPERREEFAQFLEQYSEPRKWEKSWCQSCGGEGDVLAPDGTCGVCIARDWGEHEGRKGAVEELLEIAVLQALKAFSEDRIRAEVERLLETGRPLYVEFR